MNCTEFHASLSRLMPHETPRTDLQLDDAALRHATECADCAERLAAEQTLNGALAELRQAMASERAPAEIETALKQAFAELHPKPQPVRPGPQQRRPGPGGERDAVLSTWRWLLWPTALICAFALLLNATRPPTGHTSATETAVLQVPARTPVVAASDFFPLQPPERLEQATTATLVPVELPRAWLAQFGLPINPERAAEPIASEVLVGTDGTVLAMRFLQ